MKSKPSIGLEGARIIGDRKVSSLMQFSWSKRHDSTAASKRDYRAELSVGECQTGCGTMTRCICAAADAMVDEIERLRAELADFQRAYLRAETITRAATIEECANLMQIISLSLLMRPTMEEALRAKTYMIDAIRGLAKEAES